MFLNIPPNDYNLDETINSLYYGTRVKCITNELTKNFETKEMMKFKEKFHLIFEENENLKKALKKNSISGKDNLKVILNNSFASDAQNKRLENMVFSEGVSANELENFHSLV